MDEFLRVQQRWREEIGKIGLLSNYKYQAHLRNHGSDFDAAKRRIKQINIDQLELHVRAKRYKTLFETNEKELEWLGINKDMV